MQALLVPVFCSIPNAERERHFGSRLLPPLSACLGEVFRRGPQPRQRVASAGGAGGRGWKGGGLSIPGSCFPDKDRVPVTKGRGTAPVRITARAEPVH